LLLWATFCCCGQHFVTEQSAKQISFTIGARLVEHLPLGLEI